MTSTVIVTLVVAAAIVWLAVLGVNALRSRGNEEIPANLAPGEADEVMETRRLERAQQAAVLLSAFLAISLPIYYIGEPDRQEQFIHDFEEQNVERGLHHYEEFGCGGCHAPDGSGGSATYVEKRSGVTVSWEAPSINDVFYRYDRDEVVYWLTFGRGNSPMPAWGLEGGGPMNEQQIEELADYLASEEFAIGQPDVAAEVDATITAQLNRLQGAEAAIEAAIVDQRQLLADLRRAESVAGPVGEIGERAEGLLETISEGVDTDGDGVADAAEDAVNQIQAELVEALLLPGVEPVAFSAEDPATTGTPDLEAAEAIVEVYRDLAESEEAPVLGPIADAIEAAIEGDTSEAADAGSESATPEEEPAADAEDAPGDDPAEDEGPPADTDGDGLTDQAEQQINGQITQAVAALLPDGYSTVELDPANPESTGSSDLRAAESALNAIGNTATNLRLNADNGPDKLIPAAEASLADLLAAQEDAHWEFDEAAIADEVFDGDGDRARRVVGIYQGYCARCHTSGYSAGLPFTQEPGSGGFGPALWDGRPAVQFLDDESLVDFLTNGAVANTPYGVNGFGSGRMPGFGKILSEQDLADLAAWLRAGNLDGQEGD